MPHWLINKFLKKKKTKVVEKPETEIPKTKLKSFLQRGRSFSDPSSNCSSNADAFVTGDFRAPSKSKRIEHVIKCPNCTKFYRQRLSKVAIFCSRDCKSASLLRNSLYY